MVKDIKLRYCVYLLLKSKGRRNEITSHESEGAFPA